MKMLSFHLSRALLPAAVMVPAFLFAPVRVSAQRAQSRLTPLIVHPSAEPIGSSLRMSHERVDLSTITREDTSMRIGRELAQGESVTTIRHQSSPTRSDTARERRQQVIREQDDLRHKRITVIFDD